MSTLQKRLALVGGTLIAVVALVYWFWPRPVVGLAIPTASAGTKPGVLPVPLPRPGTLPHVTDIRKLRRPPGVPPFTPALPLLGPVPPPSGELPPLPANAPEIPPPPVIKKKQPPRSN
jgi:hypothetical protein